MNLSPILMLFLSFATVAMHPAEETTMELQWNPAEKTVEVAWRLSTEQEADFLGEASGWFRKADASDRRATDWLRKHLRNRLRMGSPAQLDAEGPAANGPVTWVGRQPEGAHVWWYFQWKSDQQPTHLRIRWPAEKTGSSHPHRRDPNHPTIIHTILVRPDSGTKTETAEQQPRTITLISNPQTVKLPWPAG